MAVDDAAVAVDADAGVDVAADADHDLLIKGVAESGGMRQETARRGVPDCAGFALENPAISGRNRQELLRRIAPDLIKLFFCPHIFGLACLPLSAHETHLNK